MVYLNRTVTDKSKQPVYDGSRLKVDYVKIEGKWLIKLHHSDLGSSRLSVPASASRNERAQRSTS